MLLQQSMLGVAAQHLMQLLAGSVESSVEGQVAEETAVFVSIWCLLC
jgi:hypothetical protein